MEERFGQPLDHVRIHSCGAASALAERLDAKALTVGDHIMFGAGEYAPGRAAGRRLLAHELAHTVQQRAASVPTGFAFARAEGHAEREADSAARAVVAGRNVGTLTQSGPRVALQEKSSGQPSADADSETYDYAGTAVSQVQISLARRRVGFDTPLGMILGNVDTDLKPGEYVLSADVSKRKWLVSGAGVKSGLRFWVTLDRGDPWTLAFPQSVPLRVSAGSLAEPKTFGDMLDPKSGSVKDPLWLHEGLPTLKPIVWADDFESVYYDIGYRAVKGGLSKFLQVHYRDRSRKDINIDDVHPDQPRLWAAKQESLRAMDDYNALFILGVVPVLFWLITISPTVGVAQRFTASRRPIARGKGIGSSNKSLEPTPQEGEPPVVEAPGGKAPASKAPSAKTPEVKAPEIKAPEAPAGKAPSSATGTDPVAFGRELGTKIKGLLTGKRAAIANGVSEANLSQADAATATAEASKAAFGRIANVPMANGDVVVASVNSGANQPVFIVSPGGKVTSARATIAPSVPLNLERPITISNIKPEP